MWQQVYDPFGNSVVSTIAAAIPVVTLLVLIATGAVKTHLAALIALAVAIVIAILLFTMPAGLAIRASILGAVIGFFPIGWIVLNVIFMYRLTVATGAFGTLQQAIGGVTPDRRLQLLLIAFAFGAFFEGASGFGTPVAVTAAMRSARRTAVAVPPSQIGIETGHARETGDRRPERAIGDWRGIGP